LSSPLQVWLPNIRLLESYNKAPRSVNNAAAPLTWQVVDRACVFIVLDSQADIRWGMQIILLIL